MENQKCPCCGYYRVIAADGYCDEAACLRTRERGAAHRAAWAALAERVQAVPLPTGGRFHYLPGYRIARFGPDSWTLSGESGTTADVMRRVWAQEQ